MAIQFPRSVFMCPGEKDCQGGTYNSETANNTRELNTAIRGGWSKTLPDARKTCEDMQEKNGGLTGAKILDKARADKSSI